MKAVSNVATKRNAKLTNSNSTVVVIILTF